VLIIEDLVSRKWLTHLVSSEETTTQVQAAFTTALESEGLLEAALARAATGRVDPDADDGINPLLLAVSDNGSQMIATAQRRLARQQRSNQSHNHRPDPQGVDCSNPTFGLKQATPFGARALQPACCH
jgi:transposase InsO family protein